MNEKQTADMIKFTCQPPHVRANKIKDGLKILNYQGNEFIKDFGMKISTEMAEINGKPRHSWIHCTFHLVFACQ